MRLYDISLLGWLHSAVCMVALFAGPMIFVLRKGTRIHRKAGYSYAMAMLVANVTALGLYAPIQGLPTFNRFHWIAIATLALVSLGVWTARHQRSWLGAYSHPVLMVASYEMLLGGAINEAFARIDRLRAAAMAGSPWAHTLIQTRMLNTTQAACSMLCLALAIVFVIQVAMTRSTRRKPALLPAE
jgi:uncharacterized membrane protein